MSRADFRILRNPHVYHKIQVRVCWIFWADWDDIRYATVAQAEKKIQDAIADYEYHRQARHWKVVK